MEKVLGNKYLLWAIRIIVGIVFIYASFYKIISPFDFAKSIKNYDMMPIELVNLPAIILPYLEFICGVLLITGKMRKGTGFWMIVMLVGFIIGLTQAYMRGLDINCGCFNPLENASSKSEILVRIVEDILMLAGVLIYMIFGGKKENNKEIKKEPDISPAV